MHTVHRVESEEVVTQTGEAATTVEVHQVSGTDPVRGAFLGTGLTKLTSLVCPTCTVS
ncbi:hypothetical protein [Methylobacterium nigriterrae]|uniref:hypothetical protein n=1 Tax=Methylobacterium nigriterrae TaxID=3127512 RepID=UPI003013E7A3